MRDFKQVVRSSLAIEETNRQGPAKQKRERKLQGLEPLLPEDARTPNRLTLAAYACFSHIQNGALRPV